MDKDEIRQKIAIELFESGFLTKTAKNLLKTTDKNIIDMFVSDIIFIILTFKPVSKIYNLMKKNEIEYFVTKIMLNQKSNDFLSLGLSKNKLKQKLINKL